MYQLFQTWKMELLEKQLVHFWSHSSRLRPGVYFSIDGAVTIYFFALLIMGFTRAEISP
jgi:hypothetical protein